MGSVSVSADADADADTDTDPMSGRVQITDVDVRCEGDTWVIESRTDGWTGHAIINLWETAIVYGWDEEHTVPSVDYDPGGSWDRQEQRLQDDSTAGTFEPDRNTVFTCGLHDVEPRMTYMLRVYDTDDALADCLIWSTDPDGVDIMRAGMGPQNNPVTDPGDLARCPEL